MGTESINRPQTWESGIPIPRAYVDLGSILADLETHLTGLLATPATIQAKIDLLVMHQDKHREMKSAIDSWEYSNALRGTLAKRKISEAVISALESEKTTPPQIEIPAGWPTFAEKLQELYLESIFKPIIDLFLNDVGRGIRNSEMILSAVDEEAKMELAKVMLGQAEKGISPLLVLISFGKLILGSEENDTLDISFNEKIITAVDKIREQKNKVVLKVQDYPKGVFATLVDQRKALTDLVGQYKVGKYDEELLPKLVGSLLVAGKSLIALDVVNALDIPRDLKFYTGERLSGSLARLSDMEDTDESKKILYFFAVTVEFLTSANSDGFVELQNADLTLGSVLQKLIGYLAKQSFEWLGIGTLMNADKEESLEVLAKAKQQIEFCTQYKLEVPEALIPFTQISKQQMENLVQEVVTEKLRNPIQKAREMLSRYQVLENKLTGINVRSLPEIFRQLTNETPLSEGYISLSGAAKFIDFLRELGITLFKIDEADMMPVVTDEAASYASTVSQGMHDVYIEAVENEPQRLVDAINTKLEERNDNVKNLLHWIVNNVVWEFNYSRGVGRRLIPRYDELKGLPKEDLIARWDGFTQLEKEEFVKLYILEKNDDGTGFGRIVNFAGSNVFNLPYLGRLSPLGNKYLQSDVSGGKERTLYLFPTIEHVRERLGSTQQKSVESTFLEAIQQSIAEFRNVLRSLNELQNDVQRLNLELSGLFRSGDESGTRHVLRMANYLVGNNAELPVEFDFDNQLRLKLLEHNLNLDIISEWLNAAIKGWVESAKGLAEEIPGISEEAGSALVKMLMISAVAKDRENYIFLHSTGNETILKLDNYNNLFSFVKDYIYPYLQE